MSVKSRAHNGRSYTFPLLIEHFSYASNNLFPEQIPQPVNISDSREREEKPRERV